MSDLNDAHRTMSRDLAELEHLWNGIRGQWRDEAAVQFEKEHWRPAEQAVSDYLRALNQFIDVLDRAESEARGL